MTPATLVHTKSTIQTRLRLTIRGVVQGIGFRPFIYRLAHQLSLGGWITNTADGTLLEIEGADSALEVFQTSLRTQAPPAAIIQEITVLPIPIEKTQKFCIRPTLQEGERRSVIPPDLATCEDCRLEINNPHSRRFRYPFTTCTCCGPRYSIVTDLPYDRTHTTMQAFPLCDDCRTEYEDMGDRRFHAEAMACPHCGPQVALWDTQGTICSQEEHALVEACTMIRNGQILAIKGLGGFQLWVDASSHKAVQELRLRKHRPRKPFAVLFPSLPSLREHCLILPEEEILLTSPEAPIVLLKKKHPSRLTSLIAPDNPYIGAMLPYTPLHHLLMADLDMPIVATSGNQSEEPIVIDEQAGVTRLKGIADAFLVHNRPIARPVDDSVVRLVNGKLTILRRARGFVPRPFSGKLPWPEATSHPTILAVGGHLKNTVGVTTSNQVLVSQHIGDLSTLEAYSQFEQTVADQLRLYNVQPQAIACDLHPDYRSTVFAHQLGKHLNVPVIGVQHHHAHVVSVMVEHELSGPVLGVAWDGAGYGSDGTIWGGEFLLCDVSGFKRIAHLRPFRLPGGETCMREPRRVALSLLYEVFGKDALQLDLSPLRSLGHDFAQSLVQLMEQRVNCPLTTSMGRLFDGISSILGLRHISTFEGEAAMALEFMADKKENHTASQPYHMPLESKTEAERGWIADWRPLIRNIVHDITEGEKSEVIALGFHRALAMLMTNVANHIQYHHIVLSGGVFQNALLLRLSEAELTKRGFTVYTPHLFGTNDGGLSLGQSMVGIQTFRQNSAPIRETRQTPTH